MIRIVRQHRVSKMAIAMVLICWITNTSSAQTRSIFGVYGECWFACRYLQINPDFTFEQLLAGDLFNDERKTGTWKLVGKNKIRARTAEPSPELNVKENASGRSSFVVTIVDHYGAFLPSAKVYITGDLRTETCTTSVNGTCDLPKTSGFEVKFGHFRGLYKVKDPNSDTFIVELTPEQLEPFIDEVWLIEGERLYVSDLEDKIDRREYMKKVSTKKSILLFPN